VFDVEKGQTFLYLKAISFIKIGFLPLVLAIGLPLIEDFDRGQVASQGTSSIFLELLEHEYGLFKCQFDYEKTQKLLCLPHPPNRSAVHSHDNISVLSEHFPFTLLASYLLLF
jgi:hypothetical protein